MLFWPEDANRNEFYGVAMLSIMKMQTMSQQYLLLSKCLKSNFSHLAALTFPRSSPFILGGWGLGVLWGIFVGVLLFGLFACLCWLFFLQNRLRVHGITGRKGHP